MPAAGGGGCVTPRAGSPCRGPSGSWALAHPHEWGLIFGTPVPGYQAPEDTVEPYARVPTVRFRPVVEAHAAGRLRTHRTQRRAWRGVRRGGQCRGAGGPRRSSPGIPMGTVVLAVRGLGGPRRTRQPRRFSGIGATRSWTPAVLRGHHPRRGGVARAALTRGRTRRIRRRADVQRSASRSTCARARRSSSRSSGTHSAMAPTRSRTSAASSASSFAGFLQLDLRERERGIFTRLDGANQSAANPRASPSPVPFSAAAAAFLSDDFGTAPVLVASRRSKGDGPNRRRRRPEPPAAAVG